MSDLSIANRRMSSKRRISEIDDTIEHLSREIASLDNYVFKSEFECSLMAVKLKREKVNALTAVARSQALLADMEVLIAECDLFTDVEKLRHNKKIKLDREEAKSQQSTSQTNAGKSQKTVVQSNTETSQPNVPLNSTRKPQDTAPQNNPTTSTKTSTKSSMEKKTKRKHSSSLKTSPVDISLDETILIPTLHESASSHERLQSSHAIKLFPKASTNTSDSDASLSSSIKAEFDKPYKKTPSQEHKKHVTNKKHTSDKKTDSKTKSKSSVSRTQSPTITTKTVAEINKSVSSTSNSTTVSTPNNGPQKLMSLKFDYVPIRHKMPMIVTRPQSLPRPSTSTMSPCLCIPETQSGIYQVPNATNSSYFNFYNSSISSGSMESHCPVPSEPGLGIFNQSQCFILSSFDKTKPVTIRYDKKNYCSSGSRSSK